jgi:hypothetical protein
MSTTAKKIYRYNNRVNATLKQCDIKKIQLLAIATGESRSEIVAEAVSFYFKNKPMNNQSKNSY